MKNKFPDWFDKNGKCEDCNKSFIKKQYNQKICIDCRSPAVLPSFHIFKRDNFKCIYCGSSSIEDNVKLVVEHIFPRSKGGTSELFNLATSCNQCNVAKSKNILDEDIILRIWNRNELLNKEKAIDFTNLKNKFDRIYGTK